MKTVMRVAQSTPTARMRTCWWFGFGFGFGFDFNFEPE